MFARAAIIIALFCAALAACGEEGVRISSTRKETDERGPLKVVTTLQCPQTLGTLTRKGAAVEGGTVCVYAGERGSDVSLHLVPLDGATPEEVLKAFEDRLSASLPRAVSTLSAEAEAAEASVETPPDVVVANAKGEKAEIHLPGFQVSSNGDVATVNIGGVKIRADDRAARVDVAGGPGEDDVSIQARGDAVQVRANTPGAATRANWILTDNRVSAEGWRMVGYEARGPVGGPIVVATIRSRDDDGGRAFDNAKRLVVLNVGR